VKVEYSEESPVRKALAFEIEADVVAREIESRARDYAKKVKLPGFRPGRIPTEVVKQRFKAQVLEDVAERIINKVVFEELDGRGLKPVAAPKVTDLKIDEHQPMTFRAVFETLPIVEVPEYRGLVANVKAPQVSDDDVERELARLRDEAARFDPVEGRGVENGDYALLDLAFRPVDGGKGGRDENALVEVGGQGVHPELSATLVGMREGDTRSVRLAYPEDHAAERLRGKTLDHDVRLKSIKTKVVPTADDEFAKDLGEFETLAALRAHVRVQLEAAEARRADRDAKNALLAALVEKAGFEVPEALVERHMTARTENAARGLAYQGIDPGRVGVDWRAFRESQRDGAVKAARADILLDEIARREGIEALPAEVDAEVARWAERLRTSPESMRLRMEKEGDLPALVARIREEKTLDLLKANARLTLE
jgi:trigger factor